MKNLKQFKAKLLLFLISGILFLSLGFIFVSCGQGPTLKTEDTNKGAYAIDFSPGPGAGAFISVSGNNFPSITNQPFTVEAWVKGSSSIDTPIFSHSDQSNGILVYLQSNVVKAVLGYGSSTGTAVTSGTSLTTSWQHVAVVLAPAHTAADHGTNANCTSGSRGTNPHIDTYIDGIFTACGATGTTTGYAEDPSGDDRYAVKIGSTDMTVLTFAKPNFAIDDIRFWLTARTASEISQCMNDMLRFTPPCNIGNSTLKGYWPLNTGSGSSVKDFSGNGIDGSIYSPAEVLWEGGWVTGKL